MLELYGIGLNWEEAYYYLKESVIKHDLIYHGFQNIDKGVYLVYSTKNSETIKKVKVIFSQDYPRP